MFTGIVTAVGRIVEVSPLEAGKRLVIDAGELGLDDVAIGDSIAVAGCCLTVIEKQGNRFFVDASLETLNCTTGLDGMNPVNLEKALRLADRLGGHLMSGHVDGVGTVLRFAPVGESFELEVKAPDALAKYIAPKGSITVDGVSLTVNSVKGSDFTVNLIPHTLAVTTLKNLRAGAKVNLEVDMIARYVERMLARD
jgi:riboflavin synthase